MKVVMNPMLLPGQVGNMMDAANREKSATMLRMKKGMTKLFGNSEKSIRDVFNQFDTDKGGSLSRDEIRKALQAMEMDVETDLESAMSELSAGSDGEVSYEAFGSWVEDALDASDVLEATDNILESIEDMAADMARGKIRDVGEALAKTLDVAELETRAAQALSAAGATDKRALSLQRKFGSYDASTHLDCLKSVANRFDSPGSSHVVADNRDYDKALASKAEQAEAMLMKKGHDKVEALLSQAQNKTHALGEKADSLRAKADEVLSEKGQELLGDKRVQHLLAAGQKMMRCKTMEDRLELMKETAAELLEDYEDDSRVQALMRAVGQGRKLLEDGELTEEQMQAVRLFVAALAGVCPNSDTNCGVVQLLDCGLSDEQVEALAGTGRTAHSAHNLTRNDVKVLMQVGLTEEQKKRLMTTGMKAGMALGMRLFNKHVRNDTCANAFLFSSARVTVSVTFLQMHIVPHRRVDCATSCAFLMNYGVPMLYVCLTGTQHRFLGRYSNWSGVGNGERGDCWSSSETAGRISTRRTCGITFHSQNQAHCGPAIDAGRARG